MKINENQLEPMVMILVGISCLRILFFLSIKSSIVITKKLTMCST